MAKKRTASIIFIVLIIAAVLAVAYFLFVSKENFIVNRSFNNLNFTEIQYQDLSKHGSEKSLACVSVTDYEEVREKNFIINSQSEYEDLLKYKSFDSQCENFVLPSIDFSNKTLLGKYASGGGCKVEFLKKVYKDEKNKKIIFIIDIVEEGPCDMLEFNNNWILIPKIPSDYSVDFQAK